MPAWMTHKLASRLLAEISSNLRYADNITLMAENIEELKSLLMRVKEESKKAGLKLKKTKKQKTIIMASGPITSWQIEREKVEAVTEFHFLGSKSLWMLTAAMKLADDCFLAGKL